METGEWVSKCRVINRERGGVGRGGGANAEEEVSRSTGWDVVKVAQNRLWWKLAQGDSTWPMTQPIRFYVKTTASTPQTERRVICQRRVCVWVSTTAKQWHCLFDPFLSSALWSYTFYNKNTNVNKILNILVYNNSYLKVYNDRNIVIKGVNTTCFPTASYNKNAASDAFTSFV